MTSRKHTHHLGCIYNKARNELYCLLVTTLHHSYIFNINIKLHSFRLKWNVEWQHGSSFCTLTNV